MARLSITLPDALAAKFLQEVRRQRRPISWVARDAIREYLKNVEVASSAEPAALATSAPAFSRGRNGASQS